MSQLVGDKIKEIQEKLQKLLKEKAILQKENLDLRSALVEAKQQALVASASADQLQIQLDARKYSQATMDTEEKKAFEKKINGYIREIDKCIALLNL